MNNPYVIALLSSSVWGVLNALVAGIIIRRKTDAERAKLASESEVLDQDAEDRIYNRLRDNLADALTRAANAERHADEAVNKSNRNGFLIYKLVDLIQSHRPWDVRIFELLESVAPELAAQVGPPPDLNPYEILAQHQDSTPPSSIPGT